MKNYNKILMILCGAAILAVSCDKLNQTPVFEASESFAAFVKGSVSVDENKGQVIIPVQIASIDPVNTTVSYKIVEGEAKVGTDFQDTNESAVLTFKDGSRSENIIINIVDRQGEYTGDLDFSIELIAATGLKLSAENTCKVTICDLDHPLAEILGAYTATATSSYDGEVKWTMTLLKDPKELTMVWIDQITNEMVGEKCRFYAIVNKDEEDNILGITVPSGQYGGPLSGYLMWLVGNKAGTGYYFDTSLTWAYSNGTFTYVPAEDDDETVDSIGILACQNDAGKKVLGWWNKYEVPPTYVKD
jgi:hypothetical protein